GDDIITECMIDGTLLDTSKAYKLSSRLGLPNINYNPPTAEIDNIVANTETGIIDWDLNLTPGFGSFTGADTIEILIKNNSTDALLYTITGFYGDNIEDFTGAFAAYLSGAISETSNLTF